MIVCDTQRPLSEAAVELPCVWTSSERATHQPFVAIIRGVETETAPTPFAFIPAIRYGGAITAALYLDEFVGFKSSTGETSGSGETTKGQKVPWIHMDFMALNQASKPGRPEGGEAQGMRALFALLDSMFGPK